MIPEEHKQEEQLLAESKRDRKSLGKTLKDGRELIGLTLRQVEETINISNAYLSQLENDKIKKPSANVLYKLSNLYRIELDELLYAAGIIEANDKPNKIIDASIGIYKITSEEEDQLIEYLRFLRFKKNKNPHSMTDKQQLTPLDVIKKMADDNSEGLELAPLANIISVDQKGNRCTFTIGVSAHAVNNWLLNKTGYGGLFLIDKDAYCTTEKELKESASSLLDAEKREAVAFMEWMANNNYMCTSLWAQQIKYWRQSTLSPEMNVEEGPEITTEELYAQFKNHHQ